MAKILRIQSGGDLRGSATRKIGQQLVDGLLRRQPHAELVTRDLVARPVPHIEPAFVVTANGVEGTLGGKKAILVLGSGAVYSDGPFKALDFHEPYLRAMFGFIGLTNLRVVRVEGLNMGPDAAAAGIANATARVAALLAEAA